MGQGANSFNRAAKQYEKWLSGYCNLDRKGLADKKKKMEDSAFAFLRGTFFRWPYHLKAVDPSVLKAPKVLCVGDIHLENYGTWRDEEGRLVWGVNDFDEAAELPFTSDLVRLATSALLEIQRQKDDLAKEEDDTQEEEKKTPPLSAEVAIAAIAKGYDDGLKKPPAPFVLENHHPILRNLAIVKGKDAASEWKKIRKNGAVKSRTLDASVRDLLLTCLPPGSTNVRFYRRRAGLGSLGRERYVAVGAWYGGLVAREAKAAAPSAICMPQRKIASPLAEYRRIVALGFRARDPHLRLADEWVVRRLSPESRKIEIAEIEKLGKQKELLEAMGRELANIHRGTAGRAAHLQKFLATLPESWLQRAANAAAKRVQRDFKAF
jgi:uncharacterized protein (DUF2252 family)